MAKPLSRIDKDDLMRVVCDAIQHSITTTTARARATAASAVNDEQRPENEYDTRGLEESYLAAGQAQRVADLEVELASLRSLPIARFRPGAPIAATALVRVEDEDGEARVVFLLPAAGGVVVEMDGEKISIVSPQLPLGQAMVGRSEDDDFDFLIKGKTRSFTVIDVS